MSTGQEAVVRKFNLSKTGQEDVASRTGSIQEPTDCDGIVVAHWRECWRCDVKREWDLEGERGQSRSAGMSGRKARRTSGDGSATGGLHAIGLRGNRPGSLSGKEMRTERFSGRLTGRLNGLPESQGRAAPATRLEVSRKSSGQVADYGHSGVRMAEIVTLTPRAPVIPPRVPETCVIFQVALASATFPSASALSSLPSAACNAF